MSQMFCRSALQVTVLVQCAISWIVHAWSDRCMLRSYDVSSLPGFLYLQVLGLTLILLCSAARSQDAAEQQHTGNKLPLSERQFQKAMLLRQDCEKQVQFAITLICK